MPALIVFLLLAALAQAAGLLGIWLAIVIVPAFFRYLLYLLEARAAGRATPLPGIELFNWVENFWSLFPLVLVCLLAWVTWFLANRYSPTAAWLFGILIISVFPASMAILAVTRSPLESLNPAALVLVIKNCGRDYSLIPIVALAMAMLIGLLVFLNLPSLLTDALEIYALFLLFTLTGSIMYANAASIEVDIPPPREPDADELDVGLNHERTKVLNHAYGFVSRGNRAGGLQHIHDRIRQEADAEAAWQWYFEQMLTWESNEAALDFSQSYLSWLLERRRDVAALKLIGRCRLEEPLYKPAPELRNAVLAAAERQHNDELDEYLRR